MTFWPDLGAGRSVTPGCSVGVGGIGAEAAPELAAAGLVGSAAAGFEPLAGAGADVGAGAFDPPPHAASSEPAAATPRNATKRRRPYSARDISLPFLCVSVVRSPVYGEFARSARGDRPTGVGGVAGQERDALRLDQERRRDPHRPALTDGAQEVVLGRERVGREVGAVWAARL